MKQDHITTAHPAIASDPKNFRTPIEKETDKDLLVEHLISEWPSGFLLRNAIYL
jgi:hypothetical protein